MADDADTVVVNDGDELTRKSLRNAVGVRVLTTGQLNTYDVLVSDDVVFTEASLDALLAGPVRGKSVKAVATESEAAEEATA